LEAEILQNNRVGTLFALINIVFEDIALFWNMEDFT